MHITPNDYATLVRGKRSDRRGEGWQDVEYDGLVHKNLYHLTYLLNPRFSTQATAKENLITGTWYLNEQGMKPFEEKVADYIKQTGNHVFYRATPVFLENELVVRGVELEALSVEDNGEGLSFHVFCHNVQPGCRIEYKTGDSHRRGWSRK